MEHFSQTAGRLPRPGPADRCQRRLSPPPSFPFPADVQDAYTYLSRGKVFANAQTGNIVLFSTNLFEGRWPQAVHYLIPLLFFAFGVAAAQLIRQGRHARSARGAAHALETDRRSGRDPSPVFSLAFSRKAQTFPRMPWFPSPAPCRCRRSARWRAMPTPAPCVSEICEAAWKRSAPAFPPRTLRRSEGLALFRRDPLLRRWRRQSAVCASLSWGCTPSGSPAPSCLSALSSCLRKAPARTPGSCLFRLRGRLAFLRGRLASSARPVSSACAAARRAAERRPPGRIRPSGSPDAQAPPPQPGFLPLSAPEHRKSPALQSRIAEWPGRPPDNSPSPARSFLRQNPAPETGASSLQKKPRPADAGAAFRMSGRSRAGARICGVLRSSLIHCCSSLSAASGVLLFSSIQIPKPYSG